MGKNFNYSLRSSIMTAKCQSTITSNIITISNKTHAIKRKSRNASINSCAEF